MIEFIPLAHEQEVLRRVPLATFTIMGICSALLLISWIAEPTDADWQAFSTAATNAVEYWRGRPYLAPSPTLDEVLRFLPDSEHEQVMWLMKPSPEHEASLELAYLEQENLDFLWATASDLRPMSLTSLWGESQIKETYVDLMNARARVMARNRMHFADFPTATTYRISEDLNENGAINAGEPLPTFPKTVGYTTNGAVVINLTRED